MYATGGDCIPTCKKKRASSSAVSGTSRGLFIFFFQRVGFRAKRPAPSPNTIPSLDNQKAGSEGQIHLVSGDGARSITATTTIAPLLRPKLEEENRTRGGNSRPRLRFTADPIPPDP